jgi:hypothetical protein
MDMDPNCSKESCDKFNRLVGEILKSCQIDDDRSSIVQTLTKIESSLNYLVEARNIMNEYDGLGQITHVDKKFGEIQDYERYVAAQRLEKKFKET